MKKCKKRSLSSLLLSPRGGVARAAAFAYCLFLLSIVSAQDTPPPESQKIRGIVVNTVTHEPVGRALVTSSDNRFATLTDGEGHFEFTIPVLPAPPSGGRVVRSAPVALTSLTARKPGFLDDRSSLMPGPVDKDNWIGLVPEALIIGHVVLPSSEPSDRIQLELYRRQVRDGRARWGMQAQVTSKSNGEFRFAELPAGSYKLLTRELLDNDPLTFSPQGPLFGYPPVYFPGAGDFVSAETIEVTAGKTFLADITLVKQRYFPVKVAVANAQPGGGIQVLVYAHGHRGPGYSLGAGTNIEGMLPSGTYTVEAASFGANSSTGSVSITVKDAPLDGTRMVLLPTSSIAVNVKEEFTNAEEPDRGVVIISGPPRGNPVGPRRYLNIYLEPADDFGFGQGASPRPPTGPEDESLVIEDIRPGRYWVKVNSSRGYASSVTWGGVDLQHQPLVITGGSSPPIEVTMRDDWAEIDGTVEGPGTSSEATNAAPSQGPLAFEDSAHLYLIPLPDSSGEMREAWLGREGKISLRQIPPGVYRALVFDRQQVDFEYHSAEAMRAYESKGQVVRLVGNQKEQVHLQLITKSE